MPKPLIDALYSRNRMQRFHNNRKLSAIRRDFEYLMLIRKVCKLIYFGCMLARICTSGFKQPYQTVPKFLASGCTH